MSRPTEILAFAAVAVATAAMVNPVSAFSAVGGQFDPTPQIDPCDTSTIGGINCPPACSTDQWQQASACGIAGAQKHILSENDEESTPCGTGLVGGQDCSRFKDAVQKFGSCRAIPCD